MPTQPTQPSVKKSLIQGLQRLTVGLAIVLATWWWLAPSAQQIFEQEQAKRQNNQPAVIGDYKLPEVAYYKAKITSELANNNESTSMGIDMRKQLLEVVLLEGPEAGKNLTVEVYSYKHMVPLTVGQTIIVRELKYPNNQKEASYSFVDVYRLESATYLVAIFVIVVLILVGLRGLTSFLGLAFSVVVLILFFLPQILQGSNIYWLTGITATIILLVSVYLAHGFNKKSIISTVSILITIGLATLFSLWAVAITKLSGFSSEEAVYLASSKLHEYLDLKGILLAGIIISTIGLLDDVAITQAATVEELYKANPQLTTKELFWRAMNVGKEHVVSMINTLALIYAGGALPLLILLTISSGSPLWIVLNHESVVEEIVRTISGSLGLLSAIPVTTFLAAKFIPKSFTFFHTQKTSKPQSNQNHSGKTDSINYTSVIDKLTIDF